MQSEPDLAPVLNQSDVDRSTREIVVGYFLSTSAIADQGGLRPTVSDLKRLLAVQFGQLRVADNCRYLAFFECRGQRYVLQIEHAPSEAFD